jgi:hypothetical protein
LAAAAAASALDRSGAAESLCEPLTRLSKALGDLAGMSYKGGAAGGGGKAPRVRGSERLGAAAVPLLLKLVLLKL